jgi:succinyl-diaminopimelate desuccinylase
LNPDPKDLLVKLIKCKSVTPNDNGALSVIEDVLNANNFECERLPFGSGAEKVLNYLHLIHLQLLIKLRYH